MLYLKAIGIYDGKRRSDVQVTAEVEQGSAKFLV